MLLNKKSEDTVVIGKRYAVRNVIRSDEYGEVCKAYDTVMLRTVRMTRLIAEDAPQEVGRAYELYRRREQFLQAYRTLSSLRSSSLPLIYTIQQEGMGAFAVYENVCAPSLGEMLRTEKRVSFETAKERLLPVTAALKLMHDKGVSHGNVSKDSIVMTNTTAVLSDAVGIDADAAQDIRALLSLMFRMMTGKHLQTAQTQETAVQKSSEHDALVQDAKETPLSAPDKIEDIYSHSDNGSPRMTPIPNKTMPRVCTLTKWKISTATPISAAVQTGQRRERKRSPLLQTKQQTTRHSAFTGSESFLCPMIWNFAFVRRSLPKKDSALTVY